MPADDPAVELMARARDEHTVALFDGLIAECRCGSREDDHDIKVALAALRDAGYQVLPPGGETREQWTVRKSSVPDGGGVGLPSNSRDGAEYDRDRWLAHDHGYPVTAELVRRTVTTWPDGTVLVGPWQPTPKEETP